MKILYLGDIHGNFVLINQYIRQYKLKNAHIIQVGDYGVGFSTLKKERVMLEMFHKVLVKNNIYVWAIRGNHDFKPYFDKDPFNFSNIRLVKDYTVLNLADKNILFIGGAVSVDRMLRKTKAQKDNVYQHGDVPTGEQWWEDEVFVLDREKLGEMRNINIVVTHTAPAYCPPDNTFGFGPFVDGFAKNDPELKTDLLVERQMLSDAFQILKLNNNIDLHVYGHFHRREAFNFQGTEHRLLGVGELWEEKDYKNFLEEREE